MLGEFGQLLLSFALVASFFQTFTAFWGVRYHKTRYIQVGLWANYAYTVVLSISFLTLVTAFVIADLSLRVVVENSHALVPIFYKVTGVWGNHEGSLFLWCLVLAVCSTILLFQAKLDKICQGYLICILGMFSSMLMALLAFTSNPFDRLHPPALFGGELNPILQNVFLAIHPPMLYIGYVLISVACGLVFAIVLSAIKESEHHQVQLWALLQKVMLMAWVFLGAGIVLGSFWAYSELGWGGFWFWDPVENVSLMPWLIATAVIHAGNVARETKQYQLWIVSLVLIAFLLSLVGTFLVRSGLLVSPHTFASDPARGLFLLLMFVSCAVGGFSIIIYYSGAVHVSLPLYFFSKENAMFTGSMILLAVCAGVLIGTLYPLFVEIFWNKVISVGHPYYNFVFVPMGLFIIFLAGLAPLLLWRHNQPSKILRNVMLPLILAVAVVVVAIVSWGIDYVYAACAIGVALWLLLSMAKVLLRVGIKPAIAMVVAHVGLAVVTVAIVGMTAFDGLATGHLAKGEQMLFDTDKITLEAVTDHSVGNYKERQAHVRITRENGDELLLYPTRRKYSVSGVETIEPYIYIEWWQDYHAILGSDLADGKVVLRFYKKPLALWLWLGGALMVFGGILGIFRRWRWI